MATDPVLEPFQLKGLRLKNRIMSTAHAPSYVEDGKPKQRYRLYHEEKAKGGLALTMFGGSTTTAPDSPSAFGQINAATDAIIPWFQQLAEAVHRHDCALDVPDHPHGAADLRRRRRLAADPGAEPGPRAAAPLVPEDDRAARDQARAQGLRRRGAAVHGGRARRGRGDRLGASGRPVPVARRQPPHRCLWRQHREPLPVRARGVRRHPRGGRPRFRGRHPADRRRARGRGPRCGRMRRDGQDSGAERPDRLLQRRGGHARDRRRGRLHHPQHGPSLRRLPGPGPAHPRRHRQARLPGLADPRPVDRALGAGAGLRRHGGHDPRPHRRPAHRGQAAAAGGAPHPPLRRHGLLHRPDLPGQGRALHPQRRHRPRGHHAARRAAEPRAPGARSWSSAAGSAAWRRRGSHGCAATRWCCSRPAIGWAARSISRPRRRAARRSPASPAGWRPSSRSWAWRCASTPMPRPTRSRPWPRTWSSSPPAACRTRASCKRAKSWSPASGTCWAAMSSSAAACCSTTTMAGIRARRPRWRWPRRASRSRW